MDAIDTYLTAADFKARLDLPAAFDLTEMQPYWAQLYEGWLADLLPATHSFWLVTAPANDTPITAAIRAALKRFAVYAIWADYVLEGSFRQTKSGLVIKANDQSDALDPKERAVLHRRYLDKATAAARTLADLARPVTSCEDPAGRVGSLRVAAVLPPDTSSF